MNKTLKALLIWIGVFVAVILAWNFMRDEPREWRAYEDFTADVEADRVIGVTLHPDQLDVELLDGSSYSVSGSIDPEMAGRLREQEVYVEWGGGDDEGQGCSALFMVWGPVLLIVALWIYFMKRMGGGAGGINAFKLLKSPARLLEEKATATFADVGGSSAAKTQLGDVVSYLRDAKPWTDAGARVPRGILLEGPPGCGKTLLARAVAGETKAKFYYISASEFVEMFVGVGASRVRDLFETARKNAPAVVFIDEIDAVGRRRGSGIGPSHDEREQTLNQLLVCLDGLERNQRVAVIAATNRADILDPALVRPGRIDRRIIIPPYDADERLEILEIHARGKKLAADADLKTIADATEGATGADLESMMNEAALLAVRRSLAAGVKKNIEITAEDLEAALATRSERELAFDRLDMILVESASQMSEVTGRARARFLLADGSRAEGEVVWADAAFIKIHTGDGSRILAKSQIAAVEALAGTEAVGRDDLAPDQLAGRVPGVG